MSIRGWKSLLLSLLVVLSILLSFELWHGLWLTPSYAAWTGPVGMTPVDQPNLAETTRPVQIVYHRPAHGLFSLSVPDTAGYQQALALLRSAQLYNVRAVYSLPATSADAVEYDFGCMLTRAELVQWIPAFQHTGPYTSANAVYLYVAPGGRTVQLALATGNGYESADTDLNVHRVEKLISDSVTAHPWLQVNADDDIYLPKMALTLPREQWQTTSVQVLPLVRSFFVNPQVLTRIDENPDTVLWTDGSRAVEWNRADSSLTFSDPNPGIGSAATSPLSSVVPYLQSHGGTPPHTIVRDDDVLPSVDGATAYTFRPYIDGYPLLGSLGDYTVNWLGGHTVEYRRPLVQLSKLDKITPVQTLSASAVEAVIHQQMPKVTLQSLDIRLGYAVQPLPKNAVQLEPVFQVSQGGVVLWQIDAVTGSVWKGGVAG